MLNVPYFRQSDDSLCGTASLRMVFAYYGHHYTEEEISKLCNHTYEFGCTNEDMKRAAISLGFDCYIKDKAELSDIKEQIKLGNPVIVDWFCGDLPDGHASVVVGIDGKFIYILDPLVEDVREIELEDFYRIWFDFLETPITPLNLTVRQLIVINRKQAKQH